MNKKQIIENTSSYHDDLIESLQNDSELLSTYLQVTMEDYQESRDMKSFLVSLRNIVEAKGGIAKLAEKTKLNRQALYKTLSLNGNPRFETLDTIIRALGFEISIQPIQKKAA